MTTTASCVICGLPHFRDDDQYNHPFTECSHPNAPTGTPELPLVRCPDCQRILLNVSSSSRIEEPAE